VQDAKHHVSYNYPNKLYCYNGLQTVDLAEMPPIFFEILTQMPFLYRTTIMVPARSTAVFVDGQNGFCPFLPHFSLRAKRIMPVFGVIFVMG